MRPNSIAFFVTIIAVFGISVSAFSQKSVQPPASNAGLAAIRTELGRKVESGSFPSVSIGVVRQGKTVWKESFGYADLDKKIRATPDTIYAVGSVSKSITGTAVFRLVQDGKVSLDQPIRKYLRSQRIDFHNPFGDDYKVYHILNMAAGIPHFWRYCYLNAGDPKKCGDELLSKASFSAFTPGTAHVYSNLSFGLAGRLVADVSGSTFAEYLSAEVFRPSGMRKTFTHINEIPLGDRDLAVPYKRNGSAADRFQFEPSGGGGFFSTANDLLKFGSIHLEKKKAKNSVLGPITLRENHRVRPELPHPLYANGWGVLNLPTRGTTLLSNGAIEGAAATLLVLPESEIVIVVLINKTVGNEVTDDIAFNIADLLLPDYKRELNELFERVGPLFSEAPFSPDKAANGNWLGSVISNDKRTDLRLEIQDKEITVYFGNAPGQRLANAVNAGGLIKGTLESDGFEPPFSRTGKVEVAFSIRGDAISGYVQSEILSPKPDYLLAYYFSARRQQR